MNEEQILGEARKLPIEAQRRIAEALKQDCEVDNPELKAALMPVLEKRRADFLAGRSKSHSRKESMEQLRERLYAKVKQAPQH
ncbi:MAG: hypothetical protein P1V97_22510 [Planctomycetota bacterium]|nr:hypothetical protein [Planctomycetota bacterium]